MHSLYAVPPASQTDYQDWLAVVIGDVSRKSVVKRSAGDARMGLVLIGTAASCVKFLPVVLSSAVLKREELSSYALEAVLAAARSAAVVVVEGCAVTELQRDLEALRVACKEAICIFICPENDGSLRPQLGQPFGSSAGGANDGVKQADMASLVGLKKSFYVVDSGDMRPRVVAASATSMAEQLKQLQQMKQLWRLQGRAGLAL